MVRILCLHGLGTNSDILENQIAPFRDLLPRHIAYEFYDGEVDFPPAPGIETVYPDGPFLCFYAAPHPSNVEKAHAFIEEIVEDDGPFDGIMGFSHGAAFAAGLIMRHQLEKPFESPLFRFAVFLSGSLPFSWNNEHGVDVSSLYMTEDASAYAAAPSDAAASEGKLAVAMMDDTANGHGVEKKDVPPHLEMRRFHPDADKVKIKIPTAHIFGKLDPWRDQSLKLIEMCERDLVSVYEHEVGHEVPRGREAGLKMQEVIEKVISRSQFIH